MTLYILRHGETDYNRLGLVQGSGIDADLNELGWQQALSFYEHYRRLDFELVVTSRLRRTHQTVYHFLQQDIPWIQTPDINEISWGDHEGKPSTPERIAVYEEVVEAWGAGNLHAAIPGGESALALSQRIGRFLEWVDTRPEKRILVCTHGRTMRCLIATMKGLPITAMENVRHANTGCYVAHRHPHGFEFELENDTRHLTASLLI